MDKKVVQDIVPNNRRSIRSVGEVVTRPRIRKVRSMSYSPDQSPRKRSKISSYLVAFIIIFVGIAVIAVALSLVYSKAVVTVTPKVANIDIKDTSTFTAYKEGATTSQSRSLVYDTITVSDTIKKVIPATDGPLIQTKAKGTVILYNAQSTQQKIVAGTRLSNTSGLIYRTTATVVIPQSKSGTPGSVSAGVIADQAGANYNMSLSDDGALKIVAYKGTPKYTTVYGKTKTAIVGGYLGNKKTFSPDAQKKAVQSAKDSLKVNLIEKAKISVPEDSIFFEGAHTIEYEVSEPSSKDKENAEISVKGILYGGIFKKSSFLKSIATKEIDKFPTSTYNTDGVEDLELVLVNTKDFSAKKGTSMIFTLKGAVTLVGTFSEMALKNELKGTHLNQSNTIFSHYPAISNVYARITPFWIRSFPNSADKILIEIKK